MRLTSSMLEEWFTKVYSMDLSDAILVESRSARDEGLAKLKVQHSEQQILNKVKNLFFAVWQDVGRVSREQLADFYEVPVKTIDSNYQRSKDEFEVDGVGIFLGQDLKEIKEVLSLSSYSKQAIVYTPAGALRMGFLLRDSEVAKQVRTASIRFIQGVGQQLTSKIVLSSFSESNPAFSHLVRGNKLKISAPYSPSWDKMKSSLKRQYSTGGIPGLSADDIRQKIQYCSTYTDHFKLQGVKELKWEVAGEVRGKYPALTSDIFSFESGEEIGTVIFMFQFQDTIIDLEYVQECIGRGYIQVAKQDLKVDRACLVFVAPFGATSYAEDYIHRYLSDDYKGYVGVLTVKELADILYEQAWNARQLGLAKGEITKKFAPIRNYDFPDPPAIHEQLSIPGI